MDRAPRANIDEEGLRAEFGDFAGYNSDGDLLFVTDVPSEVCGYLTDPNLDESPCENWAEHASSELGIVDSVCGYLLRKPRDSYLRTTGEELHDVALESRKVDEPEFRFEPHDGGDKAKVTKV